MDKDRHAFRHIRARQMLPGRGMLDNDNEYGHLPGPVLLEICLYIVQEMQGDIQFLPA